MIKIVIDTNILVSALLKTSGAEAAVFDCAAEGKVRWCVSPEILTEYADVLYRPKFTRIPREYISELLTLAAHANLVTPKVALSVSPHEPDNRFLECAEASGASYLITGNLRHFPKRHKTTEIIAAGRFLAILQKGERKEL